MVLVFPHIAAYFPVCRLFSTYMSPLMMSSSVMDLNPIAILMTETSSGILSDLHRGISVTEAV